MLKQTMDEQEGIEAVEQKYFLEESELRVF